MAEERLKQQKTEKTNYFFRVLSAAVMIVGLLVALPNGEDPFTFKANDAVAQTTPPELSINDAIANEGGNAEFTVSLSAASMQTVTVEYATADGTATVGTDYQATNGTLTFAPGQTSQKVIVTVLEDTSLEAAETFFVRLTNPTNATISPNQGQGTGIILVPQDVFAIDNANNLLKFDSDAPGSIDSTVSITGLELNETLVGIDFHPGDGLLYGVSNKGHLYTINSDSGLASRDSQQPAVPLQGSVFGVDFDPVANRLRIVSDDDQNLRINPDDSTVGTDTGLAYDSEDANDGQNPTVVGAAYTNNFHGATSTTLYDVDVDLDILVRQGGLGGTPSPNAGELSTVGSLGVDADEDADASFDIGSNDTAYAALAVGDVSNFYTINLSNGAATRLGLIGDGTIPILGIAVELQPPPNQPPTVTVDKGEACLSDRSGEIKLKLTDDSGTNNLTLTPSSGNTTLVPTSNVSFSGSGAERTLRVTAASGQTGSAVLTVEVKDADQATGTVTVTVTVDGNGGTTVNGTSGADMIFGQNGNDTLNGLDGNDLVCGGNGDDILAGGGGADTLGGGKGADSFSGGDGTDTATDFNARQGDTKNGIP